MDAYQAHNKVYVESIRFQTVFLAVHFLILDSYIPSDEVKWRWKTKKERKNNNRRRSKCWNSHKTSESETIKSDLKAWCMNHPIDVSLIVRLNDKNTQFHCITASEKSSFFRDLTIMDFVSKNFRWWLPSSHPFATTKTDLIDVILYDQFRFLFIWYLHSFNFLTLIQQRQKLHFDFQSRLPFCG